MPSLSIAGRLYYQESEDRIEQENRFSSPQNRSNKKKRAGSKHCSPSAVVNLHPEVQKEPSTMARRKNKKPKTNNKNRVIVESSDDDSVKAKEKEDREAKIKEMQAECKSKYGDSVDLTLDDDASRLPLCRISTSVARFSE